MNDLQGDDARTSDAYAQLRDGVGDSVDVERSLAELHHTPVAGPARRWAAAAVASVAAIAVAAVLVSGWADREPSETVAADASVAGESDPTEQQPSESTPASTAPDCGEPQMYVYMEPRATPEQVEAARVQLAELAPDIEWEYLDQATTYAEFQRLFEDQPDFVDAISPEDLPASFRGVPGAELASLDVDALQSIPGVLRVEHTDEYFRACQAGRSTTEPPG